MMVFFEKLCLCMNFSCLYKLSVLQVLKYVVAESFFGDFSFFYRKSKEGGKNTTIYFE